MGERLFLGDPPKKYHGFAVFESLQVGNLTKKNLLERPDFEWSRPRFWLTFVKGDENYTAKYKSGQITILPKPELRGFWGGFPYCATTVWGVAIICPQKNSSNTKKKSILPPPLPFIFVQSCTMLNGTLLKQVSMVLFGRCVLQLLMAIVYLNLHQCFPTSDFGQTNFNYRKQMASIFGLWRCLFTSPSKTHYLIWDKL